MYKQVQMVIQGTMMIIDLFILDMVGANLVLRIQWFKRVGFVLSNYIDISIQFRWMGKEVTWVRESGLSNEAYSTNELKNLATTTTYSFFCRFEFVGDYTHPQVGTLNIS